MADCLALSTLIIPLIIFFIFIKYTKARNKKSVEKLCRTLNLRNLSSTYTNGVPGLNIEGSYENFIIKIHQKLKGEKIYKPVVTIIEIELNIPDDFILLIKPEIKNIKRRTEVISKILSNEQLQISEENRIFFKDDIFDNHFEICGKPHEDIKIIFKPSIRQKIIDILKIEKDIEAIKFQEKYFTLEISNKLLKFKKIDNYPFLPYYKTLLDLICNIASEIEDTCRI